MEFLFYFWKLEQIFKYVHTKREGERRKEEEKIVCVCESVACF